MQNGKGEGCRKGREKDAERERRRKEEKRKKPKKEEEKISEGRKKQGLLGSLTEKLYLCV